MKIKALPQDMYQMGKLYLEVLFKDPVIEPSISKFVLERYQTMEMYQKARQNETYKYKK